MRGCACKTLRQDVEVHQFVIHEHMQDALAIARQSGAYPRPWTEEEIRQELDTKRQFGLVAEDAHELLGFCLYRVDKQSVEILNVAVLRDARRLGVATKLLHHLQSNLRTRFFIATVHERNVTAQLFLRALGFRAEVVIHNCYGDGEDGYVFTCPPVEPECSVNRVGTYWKD